jgi:hypothetical protein
VNVEGQIGKITIDELYNEKFLKNQYYHWVQRSIVPNYNTSNHRRGKFVQAPKNRSLVYTPTICT